MSPLIYILEPFGGSTRAHSPALPMLFWDDAAVTRGDGVFESIKIVDGKPVNLERHLDRFVRSASILGLPAPIRSHWASATQEAATEWAEKNGDGEAACTWTMSRGRASRPDIPSTWLVVKPLSPDILRQRKEGVKVLTGSRGFELSEPAPWSTFGAKTLAYAENMAALRYAKAKGYDDVIFTAGEQVLEGATSTIVTVRGQKVRTPLPEGPVLAGTTQAELFAQVEKLGLNCKQKPMYYGDLLKADSVWLVSSTRGPVRVTRLDEHKLADSKAEKSWEKYLKSKA
ncbi:aminodeoxychorismate lyase [Corynebacterium sp. H130]|uniref:aminodeoxychorismate lyase n=1 Tax=Corynebacterium sp. H130 TaxID=3133444 RepID=UPI0030B3C553